MSKTNHPSDGAPTVTFDRPSDCVFDENLNCVSVMPGHAAHPIQLKSATVFPDRYRDMIVAAVNDESNGWFATYDINKDGLVNYVWCHEDLSGTLNVGDPIAIHRSANLLVIGENRYNIFITI